MGEERLAAAVRFASVELRWARPAQAGARGTVVQGDAVCRPILRRILHDVLSQGSLRRQGADDAAAPHLDSGGDLRQGHPQPVTADVRHLPAGPRGLMPYVRCDGLWMALAKVST